MQRYITLITCCLWTSLSAAIIEQPLGYTFEELPFAGTVVYDDSHGPSQPAVLMVPNWMGPSDNSLAKARKLATEFGYVVYMCDVYTTDIRPTNSDEAAVAACSRYVHVGTP